LKRSSTEHTLERGTGRDDGESENSSQVTGTEKGCHVFCVRNSFLSSNLGEEKRMTLFRCLPMLRTDGETKETSVECEECKIVAYEGRQKGKSSSDNEGNVIDE
jgi:hypothetical protein